MNVKTIILMLFCLLTLGCESESTTNIKLLIFDITPPETQAITNEGVSVLAPDINFGKIYISFGTNYTTEKFSYRFYISEDSFLSAEDHHIASSHCNIALIPCYPFKERYCEIISNTWLECVSNGTRLLNLANISDFPLSGVSTFLILEVCPWGVSSSDQCDWQARPLRIEPSCSQYRMYECLDQDPLVLNSLEIKTAINDEDNTPLLTNDLNTKQKLWLQWQSSWLSKEYQYKIEIIHNKDGNEYSDILTQGTCNLNLSCYPNKSILCEYYARNTTGQISCQGNSEFISINQIDSSHPYETVELKVKITAYDTENQHELILIKAIRIQGETDAFN